MTSHIQCFFCWFINDISVKLPRKNVNEKRYDEQTRKIMAIRSGFETVIKDLSIMS